MDIHQLSVFLAVYRHKSFSRAALELGLKQPTVSMHIQSLEKQLNCKLFDRTGQKILPTPEAKELLTYAETMVDLASSLKAAVSGVAKGVGGRIILGASTIPAAYILPSITASFHELHPEVSFEIQAGDTKSITDKVLAHELLAGIVGASTSHPSLHYEVVADDELLIAGLPRLVAKKQLSPEDVEKMPLLMREVGSGTRQATERFFKQQGIDVGKLNVTGVFGSTDATKQAMFCGLGAAVISKYAIADELEQGKLKAARLKGLEMRRSFLLVRHRTRTLPAAYKAFVKYLLSMDNK